MIEVELPDGRILEVDAPDAESAALAAKKFLGTQKNKSRNVGEQALRQVGLAGRSVYQGAVAIPNMLANAAIAVPNLFGANLPYVSSEEQSKILGFPQPRTPTERVVGDIGEAVVGTGLVGSGAKALSKAIPAVAPLASNLLQQAASATGAATGAGTARELGAPVPVQIGAGLLGGGLGASLTKGKPSITKSEDVRAAASAEYKRAADLGGELKPTFTNKFIAETKKVLPQTEAGKIVAGENEATKLVERIGNLQGKKLSLDEYQEIDETLGDIVDGFVKDGKLTKEGKKIYDIQSSLRNMLSSVDARDVGGGTSGFDALKKARELWKQQAKIRDIEKILLRAESMQQPATGIRTGMRMLLNNPNRLRGFSKDEIAAIREASKSGIAQDVLATFGSRLLEIITATSGNIPATLGARASSMASRGIAEKMKAQEAQQIINQISGIKKPPRFNIPQVSGEIQGIGASVNDRSK